MIKKVTLVDVNNEVVYPKTSSDQVDGLQTAIDNSSVDNFYDTITNNNKASQELQTQITDMSNDTINEALNPDGIITTAINEAVAGVTPSLPQNLVYFTESPENVQKLTRENGSLINLSYQNKLYRHNIEFYINSENEKIHLSFITSYSGQIKTIHAFRAYILNYTNNEIPIINVTHENNRFYMFKFSYDSGTNNYYIDAVDFLVTDISSMLIRISLPASDITFISDRIKEV